MEKLEIFHKNPNPNGPKLVDCKGCGQRKEYHAKNLCYACYKKQWIAPKVKCKSCGRIRAHHSYGLCNTCAMRLNHYDKIKSYNAKKNFKISLEKYRELTKSCMVCGFDKIVNLHHLDSDKTNSSDANLVGLCPNCHKMIHSHAYYQDVIAVLSKKGYVIKEYKPRKIL
jgi:hypothetical protein